MLLVLVVLAIIIGVTLALWEHRHKPRLQDPRVPADTPITRVA